MTYLDTTRVIDSDDNGLENSTASHRVQEHAGHGGCSRCTCPAYEDANNGNSYCKCGHSYEDHY